MAKEWDDLPDWERLRIQRALTELAREQRGNLITTVMVMVFGLCGLCVGAWVLVKMMEVF